MKYPETTLYAEVTVDPHCLDGMSVSSGQSTVQDCLDFQVFYREVQKILQRSYGFDAARQSQHSLKRAVQSRTRTLGIADLNEYLALLDSPSSGYELANLVDIFTVGETSFFRYQSHDDALVEKIFPELIRRKSAERIIRIWSAGCATGEEPYTVAMLIREYFPELANWDVTILGTDVNNLSLFQADQNSFSYRSLRTVPKEFVEKYFVLGEGSFHLQSDCKEIVGFVQHNLKELNPAQFGVFDIILCRNVLIYFDEESTSHVVNGLLQCLDHSGYIFFGHTEMMQNLSSDLQSHRYRNAFYYRLKTAGDENREEENGTSA